MGIPFNEVTRPALLKGPASFFCRGEGRQRDEKNRHPATGCLSNGNRRHSTVYFTPNRYSVTVLYTAPGRRIVDGKPG